MSVVENEVEEIVSNDESNDDVNNEEEDDVASLLTDDIIQETVEEEIVDTVISADFSEDDPIKVLHGFPTRLENIISEFADVEIFLISLDGLFLELTAHDYLNWDLGGQTIIFAKQIDIFLEQLSQLGGKFKLIWFTDLIPIYSKSTVLNFLRSFLAAYLVQSKRWSAYVVEFKNPLDPKWTAYLCELTPSFLMIGICEPSNEIKAESGSEFSALLASVALDALKTVIPIVYFAGSDINLCSVQCYRVQPVSTVFEGWYEYLSRLWNANNSITSQERVLNLSTIEKKSHLWADIIKRCKESDSKLDENFDKLAIAVLIACLVIERRGVDRVYLPTKENPRRNVHHIAHRRKILETCSALLDSINFKDHPLKFCIDDLWDGRLILGIYDKIVSNEMISPYRIQTDLVELHQIAGLKFAVEVDVSDRLFDALPESTEVFTKGDLLPVDILLLKKFAPDEQELFEKYSLSEESEQVSDLAEWHSCAMKSMYEDEQEKISDLRLKRRKNRFKQVLSRWHEFFANALEGRDSNLLVDFSRIPIVNAPIVEESKANGGKKTNERQKGKNAGKGKKEPIKSKKESILEANRAKKNEKRLDDEKNSVAFAIRQGKNAVFILENLMTTLELKQSKALCTYELTKRYKEALTDYEGLSAELVEKRRVRAVELVGKLKELYSVYWDFLEKTQQDNVNDLWKKLGFNLTETDKQSYTKSKLSLDINLIYYQLAYGGELIDIHSDAQKDERVTGFHPDAWQRAMIDSVDRNHSVIVIAPTSAGKTYVSYYCIEKILRHSDEDMVVYVSPSKALTNQVHGSVYARFRNKQMSPGKALIGTLRNDYCQNVMTCQVLITIPECLEDLLLSCDPKVQKLCEKFKYIIFDEVHSISASPEAHIWEQLLLLINCPFLALSATIGNPETLHQWLIKAEAYKAGKNQPRKVDLVTFDERYSELELYLQRIEENTNSAGDNNSLEDISTRQSSIVHFMPYGVYNPVKLSMFGIPDDQKLTARQVLDLYNAMAEVDADVKKECEPCSFFNYKIGGEPVWLARMDLRKLEDDLKRRFLSWMGSDKMDVILEKLGENVKSEFVYRNQPFNLERVALSSVATLIMELNEDNRLPAICFSEDREICEKLAIQVFNHLQEKQDEFEESKGYKRMEKNKSVQRKDEAEKKRKEKKVKKGGTREDREEQRDWEIADEQAIDNMSSLEAQRERELERFKLRGRIKDASVYDDMRARMTRYENRKESTKLLLRLFERGIGFHHGGLSSIERGAVEILFRSGYLTIVFSTSTLALGINMPCKTVLFGIDKPQLTPLQFRQMSGRAGRRGFDRSGSVIFMSIPTAKVRRLLTARLSNLRGNLPFTTTFILRLFSYVHSEYSNAIVNSKSTLNSRIKIALTLLENSFTFCTRSNIEAALRKQFRMFLLFSVQLLRSLKLLNAKGEPKKMATVACFLHANEPGNIIFVYLLCRGVFHKMCGEYGKVKAVLKQKLVEVFAYLFTNSRLPPAWNPSDTNSYQSFSGAQVFLGDLPEMVHEEVKEYNEKVVRLYRLFMQSAGKKFSLQGDVFLLSGKSDSSIDLFASYVVSPFHDEFVFDNGFIPVRQLDTLNHRHQKVYFSSYAIDFWNFGTRKAIEHNNVLKDYDSWQLINNFTQALLNISEILMSSGRSKDPFVEIMNELSSEYEKKFHRAYGMTKRSSD